MLKLNLLLLACCLSTIVFAQADKNDINLDDLLVDNNNNQKLFANNAFKSSRVINGHSMEMIGKGILDVRILHRFGMVENGPRDLFGLDNASMRMGFDYGVSKNLTIGIGRSTFNKELDGFLKWRMVHQHKGHNAMPFSIIYIGGITGKTNKWAGADSLNFLSNRLGYYNQIIIGRKFSSAFSLQLSPIFVHKNLVDLAIDNNDMYALGIGTRYKITKRTALLIDAFPLLYGKNSNVMPLSIGVDIETGGHVFQLHFSNSPGMNEKAFVSETINSWGISQYRFGFNLSRVFTVKKNTKSSW